MELWRTRAVAFWGASKAGKDLQLLSYGRLWCPSGATQPWHRCSPRGGLGQAVITPCTELVSPPREDLLFLMPHSTLDPNLRSATPPGATATGPIPRDAPRHLSYCLGPLKHLRSNPSSCPQVGLALPTPSFQPL